MRFSEWLMFALVGALGCNHNTSFKAEWELTFMGEDLVEEALMWTKSSVDPAQESAWDGQSDSLSVLLRDLPVREGWIQVSGLADNYPLCEIIDGEVYYPLNVINVTLIMSVPWTRQVSYSADDVCVMTYTWGPDVIQWSE